MAQQVEQVIRDELADGGDDGEAEDHASGGRDGERDEDDDKGDGAADERSGGADRGNGGRPNTQPDLARFGAALRRLRVERGMRQNEVAQRAGVQPANLSAREQGHRLPSLRALVAVLGVMDARLQVRAAPRAEVRSEDAEDYQV